MEKIGAKRPKIDIYAYDMPSLQLASEVAQKALGHEPKTEDRWCEVRKDRVGVIVFVK